MKKITEQEAKGFIPLKENYGNEESTNASFYTITPSNRGEGWEKVTYFTNKKYGLYADKSEGDQWVYILSNPDLPKTHLKIGYTKLLPEERAKQISSSTGVIRPFIVEWAYKCFNGEMVERTTHKKLESYRINNKREFFHIELEEAIRSIEEIGNKFK
jgi:hypothetical protein